MSHKEDLAMAKIIAEKVKEAGGNTYYVGGFVRDEIMGIENKDVDIEIHGIEVGVLRDILEGLGQMIEIGASFGVHGLKGYDLDIAMPRREKAVGKGHKDFDVFVDPFLGTEKAAMRRDFTINALMQDVLTGEIVDHFHGLDHMKEKKLVHVNHDTFVEDPLRLFRGAQFAARFGYEIAPETLELCRHMDVTTLAKERVFGELEKALLKGKKPSVFFEELRKMDHLKDWFPEIEQLIGIQQSRKYHQEGDVWVHTMMVLDAASQYKEEAREPLAFMLSALCHDLGKIVATEEIDGKIHAYGHEIKGIPLAKAFLTRLTTEKQIINYVLNMVKLHMKPHMMGAAKSKMKKMNMLFDQSVDPLALIKLSECDASSSINEMGNVSNEEFLLESLATYEEIMARPYVMGRDLIEAGLKPGKNFHVILEHAHKLRLNGIPKEDVLRQTLAYARTIKND